MTDYSDYIDSTNITTHSGATTNVHNFDAAGKAPVQTHGSAAHTGTIGGEAQVTFSGGGHAHTGSDSTVIAWTSIASRPTLVSQFTNGPGYITGYCTYCCYATNCNCDCVC